MGEAVKTILMMIGLWLFFFFIRFMSPPGGWVEAAVSASIFLFLIFAAFGVFYMFTTWGVMAEEKSKYNREVEEAREVGRIGWEHPDILLPGLEYCNIAGFRSESIWDIQYFSVNDKRVEKSEIHTPQGEGWINISYWGDHESNANLYYRKIKK